MQHTDAEDEYEDDLEHEDGGEAEYPTGSGESEAVEPVEGDRGEAPLTERNEANEEAGGSGSGHIPGNVDASDGDDVDVEQEAKSSLTEGVSGLEVDTEEISTDGPQSGELEISGASRTGGEGSPTSRALLLEFLDGVESEQPSPPPHGVVGEKERPLREAPKDPQIAALTRKLKQARKLNSELQRQLHQFYIDEPIAQQLENRVKERELRIDELLQENRLLKHTERLLTKEIEGFQNSKDNFPLKKQALQEELRVCKERIRHLKEQHKVSEEKCSKLHKQAVDLAVKNKELNEKIRQLEGPAGSPPRPLVPNSPLRSPIGGTDGALMPMEVQTVLASQEESITRLQQRVTLMKKAHKAECAKFERLLKTSQDEIERSRTDIEGFHQQLFARERTARSQFLLMKKLKRTVQELSLMHQSNQHFQRFLAGRDMRMAQRNGSVSHHIGGHSQQQQQQHSLSDFMPTRNRGQRIRDTLSHLGFVMPLASGQETSGQPPCEGDPEEHVDVPSNCVRGMLMPVPPSSMPSRGLSDGAPSARTQFYSVTATSRPSSGRKNTNRVDNDSSEYGGSATDTHPLYVAKNGDNSAGDNLVRQELDMSDQGHRCPQEGKHDDQGAALDSGEKTADSSDQSVVDTVVEQPGDCLSSHLDKRDDCDDGDTT